MKQRLTRLVALGLATVMMLGVVACGSESGTNGGDTNSGKNNNGQSSANVEGKSWEEVLAEMPNELRGTSITVYNWNPMTEYPGITAVVEEFEQQTGIEVEWVTENFDTYLSKLQNMVASGESPDVMRLRSPLSSGMISTQPISVTGFDFSGAEWDQDISKMYTIGEEVYGVRMKNTLLSSPGMLLYNKSLIEKYDLDDPYVLWKRGQWTYDKFVQLMKDFKAEADADFSCSVRDYSEITSIFGVKGPIDFDGEKYINQVSDKNFVETTQKVADLMNTDHLLTTWAIDEFEAGKCLFWSGTAVYARRQNAYLSSLKESGTLYAVPYPTVEGQDEYSLHSEVEAYGIPEGAKNAAAVPYFLYYFMDRMNYDEEAFFCSTQALEVYDYCANIENKLWTTGYFEENRFYQTEIDEFSAQLSGKPGSQIISVLDSTSPVIDQRVKRYNEQLQQMMK